MMGDGSNEIADFGHMEETGDMEEANGALLKESDSLVLHSVSEICLFVAEKYGVTFSEEFTAELSKCMLEKIQNISQIMEYFAKHAGRSEISLDDFKLYFRTSSKKDNPSEEVLDEDGEPRNKSSKKIHFLNKSNVENKEVNSSFLEFLLEKMTLSVESNERAVKRSETKNKHSAGKPSGEDVESNERAVKRSDRLKNKYSARKPSDKDVQSNEGTVKRSEAKNKHSDGKPSGEDVQVYENRKSENKSIKEVKSVKKKHEKISAVAVSKQSSRNLRARERSHKRSIYTYSSSSCDES